MNVRNTDQAMSVDNDPNVRDEGKSLDKLNFSMSILETPERKL
jgi:hypothetical protein